MPQLGTINKTEMNKKQEADGNVRHQVTLMTQRQNGEAGVL